MNTLKNIRNWIVALTIAVTPLTFASVKVYAGSNHNKHHKHQKHDPSPESPPAPPTPTVTPPEAVQQVTPPTPVPAPAPAPVPAPAPKQVEEAPIYTSWGK